jgi:hypothetical protein
MTNRSHLYGALAAGLAGLLGFFPALLPAEETTDDPVQNIIVSQDLARCGRPEYIAFTTIAEGLTGIATEAPLVGRNKPRLGDYLSGDFSEEGLIKAVYLNRPGTTFLRILRTGAPLHAQLALIHEYCTE